MLQAVIYYIVTMILTKELVIAQCTVYHFKSPGESCEDIYNKNPESHNTSGYYWILDGPRIVYCGMNYTGSSCEDIYNSNPETVIQSGYYRMNNKQWTNCKVHAYDYTGSSCEDIYNNNPATRDKSGYYRINESQWTYCIMTTADAYNYTRSSSCEDIFSSNPETVIKSGYYRINFSQWTYCKVDVYNYTGSCCENIYNNNPATRDKSGYYHINDTQWIYCVLTTVDAFNYTTLSSCEDIFNNNPETVIKSGYYRINFSQWTYCKVDVYNYTGSSCEDIYNNNPATRDKSGYYHINDSQWTYCIMTTADAYNYTRSSSCEDIFNSNPETVIKSGYYRIIYSQWAYCKVDVYNYTGSSCEDIYSSNPATRDKSGYYHINDTQWIYCIMTTVDAFNYTTLSSCEDIFNNNPETVIKSGYYRINFSQWTYCKVDVYNYTGSSCEDIYSTNPATRDKSGYYHINDSQWIYCNMKAIAIANGDLITTCAGVGGGWRRIVNINISAGDDCPGEWRKATHSGVSFCRVASDDDRRTCPSASFSTNGTSYQRVCGRARGYQKGDTWALYGSLLGRTIDEDYVSGLSITYSNKPRQHIWTFASGRGERLNVPWSCPCSSGGGYDPPSYVGSHYYCESGSTYSSNPDTYYFNDTLWDGAGCVDNCCDDTTQPWFYRQLNQTTQDDIEARICSYGKYTYRSTLIDQLELYIQ